MDFKVKTMIAHATAAFTRSSPPLARYVHGLIKARRRRIEHERAFYRNLRAYCLANKLSPLCADDWKTAVEYTDDDDLSPARR